MSLGKRLLLLNLSLALIIALDLAGGRSSPQGVAVQVFKDVKFATVAGVELRLDVYRPQLAGPRPAIIFIHGGGWHGGDKRAFAQYAEYFAKLGYVCFSVNYRLAPEYRFPAQIEDVKCAVRWVRAHAREYNVDPERIAAFGSSAGGHLAALLGVLPEGRFAPDASWCNFSTESRVQAVVDYFGPMLLGASADTKHEQVIASFLGASCVERPDLCRAASPLNYVSPDDPPFILVHGTADRTVPYEQSVRMAQALQAAGVEAELVLIPGAGHGFHNRFDSAYNKEALRHVIPFLARHLGDER